MESSSLVKAMRQMRAYTFAQLDGLSNEQLLEIPKGLNNNILWNVGHILFDQCHKLYDPCGLAMPVPEAYESWFASGTSPRNWVETPDPGEVVEKFGSVNEIVIADYEKGVFTGFRPYRLEDETPVDTIEESIVLDLAHGGMHYGVIVTMKALLSF